MKRIEQSWSCGVCALSNACAAKACTACGFAKGIQKMPESAAMRFWGRQANPWILPVSAGWTIGVVVLFFCTGYLELLLLGSLSLALAAVVIGMLA